MRQVIQRSMAFSKGLKEGISAKDAEMQQKDEDAKKAMKEGGMVKRMAAIDENLKFGRGKKTTAQLFAAGDKATAN